MSPPAPASVPSNARPPLGDGSPGAPPRVFSDAPLGPHAAQTEHDMAAARAATAFDPGRIERVLRDGRTSLEARQQVISVLRADPLFGGWKKRAMHASRDELMALTHLGCKRLVELSEQHGWDVILLFEAMGALDLFSPLSLHWLAFVPVLLGQGSPEQIDRWASKALAHQILGCYLQTELGHGTNVQGLETTATFDPATDSFDIHCPTLTSTKWWAGAAGLTATHGVVQAQLWANGTRHGPHLFFVPLRNVHTGQLLPGIRAGDIGPKVYGALPGLDNGWVRFTHVKVPRFNLLSKHAKVTADGQYVRPPSDKLSYGGMIFIRSQMIDEQGWSLAKASTIALRYLHVRRQSRDPAAPSAAERSVLSYPVVQRRIVPLLAKSYVYVFAGQRMRELYETLAAELESGNTALLADVHVASSSLKSHCTKQVIDGIEEARQALGGHGFSAYSGLAMLFPTSLPGVTYEGDNYVLAQQVARATNKLFAQLAHDPTSTHALSPTMKFLLAGTDAGAVRLTPPAQPSEWYDPRVYTAALELRAARRVADFAAEMKTGRTLSDLSWDAVELARSHAEVVVNQWAGEVVAADRERYGEREADWISKLITLHALSALQRDLTPLVLPALPGNALARGPQPILSPESVGALDAAVRALVADLVPQAIGLTDAFGWSDWELGSSLGRSDGRVYESLMAAVEGNPINHAAPITTPSAYDAAGDAPAAQYSYATHDTGLHVAPSWTKYILPLLQEAAQRSGEPIRGDGSKL